MATETNGTTTAQQPDAAAARECEARKALRLAILLVAICAVFAASTQVIGWTGWIGAGAAGFVAILIFGVLINPRGAGSAVGDFSGDGEGGGD